MSKVFKNSPQQSKLILEELEERRLFSGGIEGLIGHDLDSDANAIYADADKAKAANANDETNASVAEQQSQEVVFVDAGVDNYQQLVDDIHNNADSSRNIEVVVLYQDKDGIEEISEFLSHRDDLDAIHIISHGSDGSIELGNTSLNTETLENNNLKIALWANSFAEAGDILIYGCNLAASEVGQDLINELGALTLTDVAASDDATGHESLGGDWDLEYQAGEIDAGVVPSAELQARYQHILAVINGTAGDDVLAGTTASDVISAGAGNDVLVSNGGSDQLLGEADDDIFRFTGAQDGDVYTVDGGTGTDTIDLSGYLSTAVTFGDGTMTIDMGSGQSFSINYTSVNLIAFSDITATVLTGSTSASGWSGTGFWIDGDEAFKVDMSGAGTIDIAYDAGSDTFSVTGASGVDATSSLAITDLNGTDLLVDQITLDASFGDLTTNTGVGIISLAGASSNLEGTFTIGGDLGSIDMYDLAGTLDVQGDLGTIHIVNDLDPGALLNVTGNVTTLLVDDDIGGTVVIGGDVTTFDLTGVQGGSNVQVTASVTVTGSIDTLHIDAGVLSPFAIGGDLGTFIGEDLVADMTVGGDVGSVTLASVDPAATFTANHVVGTLVFDVGGTDHGGTYESTTLFVFNGSTGSATTTIIGPTAADDTVAIDENTANSTTVTTVSATGATEGQYAEMYWADKVDNAIYKANADGTGGTTTVISGLNAPVGVEVDYNGGKLYWTTNVAGDASVIQSANLDGSGLTTLVTGLTDPDSIALDLTNGKLYWTDDNSGEIRRANLDGTAVEIVLSGLTNPESVALDVDSGKMYWTDHGDLKIQRANLDGTGVEDLVTTGLSNVGDVELDLDNGKMYWIDGDTAKIQRANLDGTGVEDLVTSGLNDAYYLALDVSAGKMYWTDDGDNIIQRANLDGTGIEDLVTTGVDDPRDVALSAPATLSGPLSYSITAGNTGNAFTIDANTGEITVADSNLLDFEATPVFSLTVEVQDTVSLLTDTATITVNLNDVAEINDAPVLTDGITVVVNEDSGGVMFYTNGTVADSDSLDFAGGTLTATISAGGEATDRLQISNTIIGTLGFSVSGNNVLDGATTIGTWAGGTGGTPLTVNFNINANVTHVEAVYRSITFDTTSDDPTLGIRTISVDVTDGDGGTSNTATGGANLLTAYNDAPILTSTALAPTWTENGGPVNLFSATSVDLVESGDLVNALTIDVAGLVDGGDEILMVDGHVIELTNLNSETTAANGYAVSVSAPGSIASVTISRTGGFTALEAQTLIDGLAYENTSDTPQGAGRMATLAMIQDDGGIAGGGSNTTAYNLDSMVTVVAINDAPTFIGNTIGNWNFDEGSGDSVAESAIGLSTGTLGSTAGADANDPTWTTGKFGQALHFDGVDDYVEIADAPGLDISGPEFSASLWMNPDSGPNQEDMLFMKGDRQGNINYYLSWKDSGEMTWAFKDGANWHYQDMAVTMPTTGQWNHIGITFDRPTVSLYVNGTKYVFDNVATGGSMDNDLAANDEVLWIGAGRDGGAMVGVNQWSGPFTGSIDELALFDRALTDADMEAIRTGTTPVVTASAFSIDENSANNTVVGNVVATDPDIGDTLSYAITAGNTGGAFSIDANGQIKVANSAVLDFETNPVFTLTIEATDDGSPNLSDTTTVTIALNEVNETPTAVDDAFVVNEDTPTNIDLLANDTDPENDTLTLLGFERIVASYDAGTTGAAIDPTSVAGGSWNFEDTEDSDAATGNLQAGGVSPDGATGLNGWNVTDGSNTFGENLWYSTTLSGADVALADANGWSLSAEIRMVDDFGDTRTTFMRYGDGTTRFLAYFDLDLNGDLTVELIDDGGNQVITLTSGGNGSAEYHNFEIVYDPVAATAMFLADGVRVDNGSWAGETSANTGVRWGMGSGGGQGSANYHSIEMKVFDQSISTANGATVTNNGDGTVNYAPASNFNGADSFAYTIRDSEGHLASAAVNVTVDAVNDDPVISSDGGATTAAINVAENTTAVTTVTATDVDLDTPTFTITGGADQGLFTILPTGELSFLVAPDFEGPGDNSYVVEITAADGNGGFDVQTITVTVTDVNDGVIRVTPLSLAPLGGETLVNTGTTDNQSITSGVSQAIATDANGNYVIVWSSNLQDGAGWGIYAQLFNADGTAQGSEIPINSTTADSQLSASVAMDAAGNFVVTWQSNLQDGDGYGIFARAFNAAGVAQGGEIPVNTYTTGYQGAPGIAMAANGDFVIEWASSVQDPDGSYGIYAQRFNAAGAAQGGEFRVNTYIPGYQQVSSISMDDAGNFVVTWGSLGQDGSNYGVFGQVFNADGSPRGAEFQANTTTQYSQLYNDVTMLPDGRFVVTYQSANADTSTDLYIQAFNADGSKHGGEIKVNAVSDMDYFPIPSISADASGNFTVVWNNSNDGALSGVFMRSYDWDGNALTGEVQVNTTAAGEQLYPEIVAQPGGGFIVAWSGNGAGDADGVFTQRYGLSTDEDGNSTSFQLVLEHAPTADVIIPVSVSDGSEGTVSTGSVTFTSANWSTPQIVTVTGVQDFILDGDQTFTVNIGPATSTDLNFNGLDPADLIVTNHETNTPPVITSDGGGATVSINVAENTTAVTTVTATDADLDTPTFTITGGADQGLFSIDLNSGLLTFDTPPNFEGPGDNSYTVEVTAADGFGGIDIQTINVSVTNVNEAPVANADSANLVFDGDDIVQVADHASLQMSNNLTMEAWFNYSSSGTGSQLILNKEGEYELGVIADTGEIQFAITQSDNTWSWHRTGVFVNPDEWAHVAVTYDGTAGEAKTYINGELVDTYLQSGNIGDVYTAYDDLFIGGRENDADERFNGQIDEVRIWDTTRSQTDIQNNYSDKLTGAEPGLAGYWRLNEADGTLVADMSANNNDGTLGGAEGAASTPTYDGYFTDQNTTLVIAAVDGVLANDFDADGDSLAVTNLDTTGMLGTLNLNAADGSFSYDPNGAFDYLDAGEVAYETFTYTANDSSLDSNVVSVTITVVGTEDAAVVGGTVTGAVSEDGTLTSSDNLTITDADTSDNPVSFNDVAATLGDSGYGDFEITGNAWTYTLNNAHPAVQALDVGETLSDTHTFTATDGSTQQVTITINGAEDAPVFDSTAIIVATEDVAYSYTITTSDVDIENVTITAPTLPAWLTFVDNGNGTATLSGTPGNAEVGNHNVVLNVSDGTLNSNQNFTITVSNTNDPAVIGGTDTGAVQEDVAVVANNISTSGTLTITDPDTGESSFQAATITGTYGDLVMQTNGNWTYTADNTQAAIQQLDVSEFITDTLTVTSFDGTTHNVVITINGSEDAAVIGGTTTGSVTEDGTLTSSGTLTISDTDTSDTPGFADVTSTGGDNGYGNFVMTAGTWTYTLDNNDAAVQALDVGETLTDTHTFTATDGSTQVVTVTINGAEDTPVFDSTAITAATEDLAYSYTITTSDVDVENVTITAPTLPGWLTFVDNGNGTATLSGTPTNAEVGNHNVVLTVSDGTLNSNQNFTVIVANTNDPAVIGGADTGAVTEDVAVVADNISTTGTLTITDPDTGESTFQAGTITGTYGDLVMQTNGNWTYTADNTQAAIQQLDVLESITDTLTVTSFDGTTHNVVITINGTEDSSVIGGTIVGSVTEDGTLTSSGTLTISDTDSSDPTNFVDVTTAASDNGYGTFAMTGNTWTFVLDNTDTTVQALDTGETLTDTFTFTAPDGVMQQVTVTINGAEDTPVFDSTAVTASTEDSLYSYTITTSDVDVENVTITAPTLPAWLTFVDNGNGTATLSGTPSNAEVGNHNVVLNVSDGTLSSNQNFTIVVGNTNDSAVIGGTDTGTVQEDVAVVANNISTTGTLTIADPDTGESTFQAGTVTGTYGDLVMQTNGDWTYTADNTQTAIQQLDVLESIADTLTVTSFDGTTHNVVITINGSEDAAVISGTTTGSVTEDGTLTSSGALTITDTDTSDTPSFADVTSTGGDNGYGNFVMTAGTWTYTLDNNAAAVQALDVSETLTDTHTFTATDGSTQLVTVTINGAEDAPVFDSTAVTAATEDVLYSYTITTSDVDIENVTITAPTLPAWLTFVDNGNGTATLSGTPGNAEVGNHNVVLNVSDGTLNSNQNFTIVVGNTNDSAVIGGTDTGTVQEDVAVVANNINTSGSMTIADPDAGESSFVAATITGTYGDLVIDSSGNWSYSADNSQISIQALDTGETLTDTLTVTTFDGTTHNVVITINGTEDAAITGGTATGAVTEDGTLTVSDSLTITDADTADNPVSFDDVAATLSDNGYGNFEITGNTWTFTLNNAHASVQALDAGETLIDTYTFLASDGSSQVVTVTINGAEDGSVIGGTAVGAVTEDGALIATDTLTITDVDTNDNPIRFNNVAATLSDNGYGNFEITSNIWAFTLNNVHASVQALDVGQTLTDSYTFTANDGSTQTVTVTINGTEDAAVIGGTVTGTVAEDGSLTAANTLTITDTDTSDNPISFNDVASTPGSNGYGNFEITGNSWTFTLNNGDAAVQALDVGETLTDSYTFLASDGSSQLVTVTIDGAEDAPTLDNAIANQTATEDVVFGFTFAINTFGDLDTSDTFTYIATLADDSPLPAWLSFDDATRSFSGTPLNADVGALDIKITASDGSSSVTDTFTLTVLNASDPAVIGGIDTGTVTEDVSVLGGEISTTGSLTIADPDAGESSFQPATISGSYGDLAIDTAGNWIYSANNSQAAIQALDAGQSMTDTLTVSGFDGTTHDIVITINGSEDSSVVGGTSVGAVAEDGTLIVSDSLTITDVDANDNPVSFNDVAATAGDNGYGNFELTGNTWTYTLNNAHAAVQALDVGEVLSDTYSFSASDGSTQIVTVTINGAEDGSVIGGTAAGAVVEDGSLTSSNTLTITDVDSNDNSVSFNDVAATVGDNGYGNFEITGNTWTYTLNNAHPLIQALDVGETLNDTYTFLASDGTSRVVTVAINGAEDTAVVGGTAVGAVAEDGLLVASDTLTITDVDSSDNPVSFNDLAATIGDNGYGNFELTGNTWTYTLNNAHASVQALDVGETLTDSYTFMASDGSSQVVTVTINGAEDGSVIGGTAVGAVAEDGLLVASDTLTITDVDSSDNPISFNDLAATLGDNGYGNFELTGNSWTYTLNNAHASVQALDVGESLTDTYTFLASDGSTQVVTVTINGAEDGSVIGGTDVGAVTEDGTLVASDTLSITDVDSSDNPVSFNDVSPTPGINGYGNFELTGNTWSYTLNNSHAAVQALDVGETMTDLFTFSASDGSTVIVTVTIGGAEDAPTLDVAVMDQSVTEGFAFNYTFTAATFSDLDASDTLTYSASLSDSSPLPAWLSFDGLTRTFSGTPGALDVGSIDIRISADDGSSIVSEIFTLTIDPFNNLPLIGGDDSAVLTEDVDVSRGQISDAGQLTIADPDIGESSFLAQTLTGNFGQLTIDASGNWRYSADNGYAEIQGLQAGESVTETLTVTTADGSTHNIVVTINGAAEASRTPPPVVEPPVVEPPPEEEIPPPEEPVEEVGGDESSLDDIVRIAQDVKPPAAEQDKISFAREEEEEKEDREKVNFGPVVDRQAEQLRLAGQLQLLPVQDMTIDSLKLQVSDDEELNQRFELELLNRIDRMQTGMDGDSTKQGDVEVQIIMGSTASLTAGIVSWVLRGGSLLASFMSTVPLLNRFDPLPILKSREDEKDVEPDEDEDTQTNEHVKKVDNMFSAKNQPRQ